MHSKHAFALFVSIGAIGALVAGCGGEVSTTSDGNGAAGTSNAARIDCPNVAPESASACLQDGLRCEYPVQSCTRTYVCKCSAQGGWSCEMPPECMSH